MAKVSIIIPIFNSENTLIRCLDSIKNQSMEDIEVICIDDGSLDNSWNILEDYANMDSRFKIYKQLNLGAGIARNNALNKASSEFVLFVDSDDWIEHDACELLYNHAKKLDVDVVLFDALWHLNHDSSVKVSYFPDFDDNIDNMNDIFNYKLISDKIMMGNLGVIWNKFYKLSFIKENEIYFPHHKIYNDVEFHFKTLLLTDKIAFFHKVFYNYIKFNSNSLQNLYRGTSQDFIWFDVLKNIYSLFIDNNILSDFKEKFIEYSLYHSLDKLYDLDDGNKSIFFMDMKSFFEYFSLDVEIFNRIHFKYFVAFIHIINSTSFDEFKRFQNNFDGNFTL